MQLTNLKPVVDHLIEGISAVNLLIIAVAAILLTVIANLKKVAAALGFKNSIGGTPSI